MKETYLKQDLTAGLIKGKSYTILMKVQALGANPSGNILNVLIRQKRTSGTTVLSWNPTFTTTATWVSKSFSPIFSSDTLELYLNGLSATGDWGSCTGFLIDEIYIYENISADRVLISDHEMCNGRISRFQRISCDPDRTGYVRTADATTMFSAYDIDQDDTVIKSFTAVSYPIWEMILLAREDVTYEAGEMFIGPKMDIDYLAVSGFDPHGAGQKGTMLETIGGRRYYDHKFVRGQYQFGVKLLDEATHDKWVEWWEEVGDEKFPFFFCWDETSEPEDIKLVRCEGAFSFPLQVYAAHYRIGRVSLTEEL
jgi:hypothetical protein